MEKVAWGKSQKSTLCGRNKVDILPNYQTEVEKLENPDAISVSTKWHQKIGNSLCSVFRATTSMSLEDAQADYEAKKNQTARQAQRSH